ncbi:protein kinase family protein [Phaeacidiphilus oryzae]|uniref:hypothetical protein n=1 Tax=Phaeacidiphilus oryzae TaxID=348818 RepID=UPI00056BA46F|nr:hypothetical protein [Phaeacidiphilus oryzae]
MAGGRQSGGLLGGRYELSGRTGEAVDGWTGLPVVLHGIPLPETVEAFAEDADDPEDVQDVPYAPYASRAGEAEARTPADGVPAGVEDAVPGQRAEPREESAAERAVRVAAEAVATAPRHPRLVELYDSVAAGATLHLVGERVLGAPLSLLLERGPLSPYRAAEIAADLVGALRAVHAAGRRHGNVTADTVLVCEDGSALLDGLGVDAVQEALCGPVPPAEGVGVGGVGAAGAAFGPWGPVRRRARDARLVLVGPVAERWAPELAGPEPADAPGRPGSRASGQDNAWVVDTLGDAEPGPAPEGPPSGEEVGPAADAWALGVLLYRMTTGQAPFDEQALVPGEELLDAVRSGTHASASGCGPLRPLVEELLRTDPDARPTLPAVAERLAGLLARAPEPLTADGMLAVAELLSGRAGPGAPGGAPGGTGTGAAAAHGRHARPHGRARGRARPEGRESHGEERKKRPGGRERPGARLPEPREGGVVGAERSQRTGTPGSGRRGGRLLGPLLVGGVLLLMVLAVLIIALVVGRH